MTRKKEIIALIAILALGAFFRFYQIADIPPGLYPDEAANGNNAIEALESGRFKIFYPENNGREGLYINIQAAAIKFFGAEPWVLRAVSALFGTLTILGLYLLTKELFTNTQISKSESLISKQSQNPNDKNLFRDSRFEIRDSHGEIIALLSIFFLATGYWHINFSRVGFRAIMVPFFAVFALYWLTKALRTGKISSAVLAGIATGLGFHTYIAFRFMPFVLAVPMGISLWQWFNRDANTLMHANDANHAATHLNHSNEIRILASPCAPCVVALFLFITLVAALPIGFYFLQHPADFFGRGGQVSIFSAESPWREFAKSTILTLGMFNVRGDCNGRHNLACQPQLYWPVGVLFVVGLLITIRSAFRGRQKFEARSTKSETPQESLRLPTGRASPNDQSPKSQTRLEFRISNLFRISDFGFRISKDTAWLLLVWFVFLMLPATLTREGLPHALRSIGLIPPVMIFAGLGGARLWQAAWRYFSRARENPEYARYRRQLGRIQIELAIVALAILAVVAGAAYRGYFVRFADSANTYNSFAVDLWHQGQYLAALPDNVQKFVIVNLSGDDIRGVPAPAQTIMFATQTFGERERTLRRIRYVRRLEDIPRGGKDRMAIMPMNALERGLIGRIREQFPDLEARIPGEFLVFEN